LTGDILVSKTSPLFIAHNTATTRRATLESSGDSWAKIWNWKDGLNYRVLSLLPENEPLHSALHLYSSVDGTGTAFRIYGENNITASTSVPSSALAEGVQHQVY